MGRAERGGGGGVGGAPPPGPRSEGPHRERDGNLWGPRPCGPDSDQRLYYYPLVTSGHDIIGLATIGFRPEVNFWSFVTCDGVW